MFKDIRVSDRDSRRTESMISQSGTLVSPRLSAARASGSYEESVLRPLHSGPLFAVRTGMFMPPVSRQTAASPARDSKNQCLRVVSEKLRDRFSSTCYWLNPACNVIALSIQNSCRELDASARLELSGRDGRTRVNPARHRGSKLASGGNNLTSPRSFTYTTMSLPQPVPPSWKVRNPYILPALL